MQRNIISAEELQPQLNQLIKDEKYIEKISLMDLKTVNLLLLHTNQDLNQLKIFYDLTKSLCPVAYSKKGDYYSTAETIKESHWILELHDYNGQEFFTQHSNRFVTLEWPKYINTLLSLIFKIEKIIFGVTQQKEYLLKKIENEKYLENSLSHQPDSHDQKTISEKMTTASERVAFEVLQNHDVLMEKLRGLSAEKDDYEFKLSERINQIKDLELKLTEKNNRIQEQKTLIDDASAESNRLRNELDKLTAEVSGKNSSNSGNKKSSFLSKFQR